MVPNVGDYQVLETTHNAAMLVHNANGVEMISNICRHRQAMMYEGRGSSQKHCLSVAPLDL